jgi:membrane carboxypeptidase/penicillin-binding protein
MNSLLSSVMTNGTGRRALTADRRPQAGKTGTIDSNAAVWFVGYTPQVAGAAMISIDNTRAPFLRDGATYRNGLKGYTVPSTGLALEGSGSGDAGQEIWKPAMEAYLQGKAMQTFNAPPAMLVRGQSYSDLRNGTPGTGGPEATTPEDQPGAGDQPGGEDSDGEDSDGGGDEERAPEGPR